MLNHQPSFLDTHVPQKTLSHLAGRLVLIACLGLGLMVVAVGGCDRLKQAMGMTTAAQTATAGPRVPGGLPPALVETAVAVTGDVPEYLDEIGKCAPYELVSIQPLVSGRVTKVTFKDGQEIHVGDMLFEIDPRPYKDALDQANANLAMDQANQVFARADLKRLEDIGDPRAITQQDLDTKRNAAAMADAKVQGDVAAVAAAKLNLEYCTIDSPINGRAGQHMLDVGNVVNTMIPMATSMLVIQRLDPIYVDFTITEAQLARVRANMTHHPLTVDVRLPDDDAPAVAMAALGAATEPARKATTLPAVGTGDVTFIDNSVQDGSGTVKVRAALGNPTWHFWPGQFVKVRLVLRTIKDAVLIPSAAVQLAQQGPYVLAIVSGDNGPVTQMRPVKIGQRQGGVVVVEQGLAAGAMVVTSGQFGVIPGGPVRFAGAATQP